MDAQIGDDLKKKGKTQEDIEKETENEAMIAFSLGFPIDALREEEIKAEVVKELGGKEQNDYIVVRNHILTLWRENVKIWLTKSHIRESVSSDCEHLINSAYDFLFYNGYINFGVAPSFNSHIPETTFEGGVIVIGAGLAGLAAARQLLSFGYKVAILEGNDRPGGRIYTKKVGSEGNFAAVDLGGSIITGIDANPLAVLARQLSIPLHRVRDKCPLYKPNGELVEKEIDSHVESVFNNLLDRVMELRQIMGGGFSKDVSLGSVLEKLKLLYGAVGSTDEKQLLEWHFANLEYANAGCLSNLSAAHWDQDDPYEMGGDHCFLLGGNGRLINALSQGIPIFYGKTVKTVRYGSNGVDVIVDGGQVFHAEIALCTASLGVLKKKAIKFEPELPTRKLEAIERLGFGLLNKVAMLFPNVFWGQDVDTFGCLNGHSHQRGEFFLFYSYHTVSGGPTLIALVAGEAAQTFESTHPHILLNRVLSVLKGIFLPKGITVPDPIQSVCTKWGADPFSFGSYSHVSVGSSGADYDILAENVGNRLFFAGEATSRQYPATMHGAFLSGLREASHIYKLTQVPDNHPRKSAPKNIGPINDMLVDLFKKPDLEFGRFAFIFDRSSKSPQTMGILRFLYPVPEQLPLPLYQIISREQVQQLLRITGDQNMLHFLSNSLGLKLMGTNAVCNAGNSLITSIASARKNKGKNRATTSNS
ncbi:putative spermine oxidase transcription regulator Homeodomain-LIKE family [Lupinus albus]|uniref:Putative spermine oxidase transcription regulator Homeodomain-LIKE family n=1 Tax=Lupinus albus TaxID=3870 RepID=A0A6A4QTL9_LUPAL|nr:putative spermine oxidase transcription regulator Homeodomain-LIKE family [Lupinus albus]